MLTWVRSTMIVLPPSHRGNSGRAFWYSGEGSVRRGAENKGLGAVSGLVDWRHVTVACCTPIGPALWPAGRLPSIREKVVMITKDCSLLEMVASWIHPWASLAPCHTCSRSPGAPSTLCPWTKEKSDCSPLESPRHPQARTAPTSCIHKAASLSQGCTQTGGSICL